MSPEAGRESRGAGSLSVSAAFAAIRGAELGARPDHGRLLGVLVLSPHAGEVIQTGVLAVTHGLAVHDPADTLFPHPTEVEGLELAAKTFTRSVEKLAGCAG